VHIHPLQGVMLNYLSTGTTLPFYLCLKITKLFIKIYEIFTDLLSLQVQVFVSLVTGL
jgi:hypothetical protein